jgi:glycerol kinase
MSASNWTMQMLANILDAPVDRPTVLETTALGAAWLAGQYAGVWDDKKGFAKSWQLDRQFSSQMDEQTRKKKLDGWHQAIKRCLPQE